MWETTVDGRPLHFRLYGINNQNFIMRDEETGSWWQQVTGECILGPLKGRRLRDVMHDELTFAAWKRERPNGRVLRPDERVAAKGLYAPADWEARTARLPVVRPASQASDADAARAAGGEFEPRTLVVGLEVGGASKAYPLAALQRQSPVMDKVGWMPLMLVVNDDGQSIRAFERVVDELELEFFAKPQTSPLRLVDVQTGSEWDFTGTCVAGQFAGRQLRKLPVLKDYWFDWKNYHPRTALYRLGER